MLRALSSYQIFLAVLTAVFGLSLAHALPADAATKKKRPAVVLSPTDPKKDAELVIDAKTGKVLFSRNAAAERHPASLTKMMTLYMLFEALKKGQVTLTTPMRVSSHAAVQKPTKLGFSVGDSIPVETAIKAIVVRSANDVAVVIAEHLGGTESNFSIQMTQKARALGMKRTNFHNASGLPDPLQISTAEDLALLARHLMDDFPEYYPYFATPEFSYRGYTYQTHNNLIGRYRGTDGIKTGYTVASGFNLVTSVVRGDNHLIGVVLGGRSAQLRDNEMKKMLDNTYAQLQAAPAQAVASLPATPQYVEPATGGKPQAANMLSSLTLKPSTPDNDDEDSAEARRDDGLAPKVFPSTQSKADTQQQQKQSAAPSKTLVITAYDRQTKTAAKPAAADAGEGDIDGGQSLAKGAANWSIQIGAFNDMKQARDQLASYAEKSVDVLGQAARSVVPFRGPDGQTMYRARFGPFAEQEAREVCSRLTQRGQTCFATVR
jgi:D-alanyl-D-alanine carboxypeptidase